MITNIFKNDSILHYFSRDIFSIVYYPYHMPSLITKWKKGTPYLYWVRSARVNGHPQIVRTGLSGPPERGAATDSQGLYPGLDRCAP